MTGVEGEGCWGVRGGVDRVELNLTLLYFTLLYLALHFLVAIMINIKKKQERIHM